MIEFEPESDVFTRAEIQRRMNIEEAKLTVDSTSPIDIDTSLDKVSFYYYANKFLDNLVEFQGFVMENADGTTRT